MSRPMYPHHYGTALHTVLIRACNRTLLQMSREPSREDTFRSQLFIALHNEGISSSNLVAPPTAHSGADIVLLNAPIEIKYADANTHEVPYEEKGAKGRLELIRICEDLEQVYNDQAAFAVVGFQLRHAGKKGNKSIRWVDDCVRIPDVTHAQRVKAWYDGGTALVQFTKSPQRSWFAPGALLPMCDVDEKDWRVQGGKNSFLAWRKSARLETEAILQVATPDDSAEYLHVTVLGCAEMGRLFAVYASIAPEDITPPSNTTPIAVKALGPTARRNRTVLEVATKGDGILRRGPHKSVKVPFYNLRAAVARAVP